MGSTRPDRGSWAESCALYRHAIALVRIAGSHSCVRGWTAFQSRVLRVRQVQRVPRDALRFAPHPDPPQEPGAHAGDRKPLEQADGAEHVFRDVAAIAVAAGAEFLDAADAA